MTPYEIGYRQGRTHVTPSPRPWFCGAQIGTEQEVTTSDAGKAYSEYQTGIRDGSLAAWRSEQRDGEGFLAWWRRTRS